MSFSLEKLKKELGGQSGLEIKKTGNFQISSISNGSLDERINSLTAQILPQASLALAQNSAELIFLFDRSGSCYGTEEATIRGFHELIQKEKRTGNPTTVSTILFNKYDQIVHNRVDIQRVEDLHYVAEGGTALYDTLCKHLENIKHQQTSLGSKKPQKTIAVIMTDGDDLNSVRYNLDDARRTILSCKALGWEFIFLGANINAKKTAFDLGIDPNHAENYSDSENGILSNFKAVSKALESFRKDGKIDASWASPIRHNLALEEQDNHVLRLGGK